MSINHWLILSYNVLVTWWRITSNASTFFLMNINASTFFYWTFSNVWLIIDKKLIKLILKILQQQYQKVRKSDEIKAVKLWSCFSGGCSIIFSATKFEWRVQSYKCINWLVLVGLSPASLLIIIHFNYKANKYNWVYFGPGSQRFLPTYFVGKWLVAWIALRVNFDLSSVPCHASYFSIG